MKKYNREIGTYGETLAEAYLKSKGYIIIEKNFHNRFGEIDIIAKLNDIIIFFEIKSRYTTNYGYPIEAVTYSKQKQIIKISNFYICLNNLYSFNVRYDIISILFNKENNLYNIEHFEDAFRLY